MKPTLYVISGCNGSGKTTASFTILPELLNIEEFVNADEIAKGLSPFKPEKVAIEAGRLMITRINELIERKESFAFETTLSTRSYIQKIAKAKSHGYSIVLVFFSLNNVTLAKKRVALRVSEGGHNIPEDVIERRFEKGLQNLFNLYIPEVDEWIIIDNSRKEYSFIASKVRDDLKIWNLEKWRKLQTDYEKRR